MFIETSNLTKKYNNKVIALNNVSLSIGTGMFGLLGRNGSGKTTLMRLLTTLLEPTQGNISILGMDATVKENHSKIKQSIGYLPQEFGFYKEFTITEIMQYICLIRGVKKEQCKGLIGNVLENVSLNKDCNKKYKQLSGGMKRRVGLAQAMLDNPPILIVDEPTAGVDPEERIKIRKLLNEYAAKNIVLLSTHIVEDIEYTCNKLAVLDNGNLLFAGSLGALLKIAEGKIFEYVFDTLDEFQKFETHNTVISFKREGSRIQAVVIDEHNPQVTGKPFAPSLEEAYVYITKKWGCGL
jgi:ABC-2 type transport system ATP-binding protein